MKWIPKSKNKVLEYAVILLSFAPLFSMRLGAWAVIFLLLVFLLNYKHFNSDSKLINSYLFLPVVFYLVLIFGLLHTENMTRGLKILERFLAFLIVPLIFYKLSIKTVCQLRTKLMKVYIIAVSVFFAVNILYAFYRQILFMIKKDTNEINWYFFYRYDFLDLFNQHPTYVSIFSLIAITFLLFYKQKLSLKPVWLYSCLGVITLGIVLAGSRQGYIQYLLLISIYFIKELFVRKQIKKTLFLGFIFLSSLYLFFQIPIIKERVYVTFGKKQYYRFYHKKKLDTRNNPEKQGRLLSWQDAFELIKQRPFLGYGTGDDNDVLLKQYKKNQHLYLYKMEFNAHNSYIQWLLSGGLLLLIPYLLMLFVLLYYGIKKRNMMLISLFIIILFTSFTETFYRVQGIIFMAFFYSFFMKTKDCKQHKI